MNKKIDELQKTINMDTGLSITNGEIGEVKIFFRYCAISFVFFALFMGLYCFQSKQYKFSELHFFTDSPTTAVAYSVVRPSQTVAQNVFGTTILPPLQVPTYTGFAQNVKNFNHVDLNHNYVPVKKLVQLAPNVLDTFANVFGVAPAYAGGVPVTRVDLWMEGMIKSMEARFQNIIQNKIMSTNGIASLMGIVKLVNEVRNIIETFDFENLMQTMITETLMNVTDGIMEDINKLVGDIDADLSDLGDFGKIIQNAGGVGAFISAGLHGGLDAMGGLLIGSAGELTMEEIDKAIDDMSAELEASIGDGIDIDTKDLMVDIADLVKSGNISGIGGIINSRIDFLFAGLLNNQIQNQIGSIGAGGLEGLADNVIQTLMNELTKSEELTNITNPIQDLDDAITRIKNFDLNGNFGSIPSDILDSVRQILGSGGGANGSGVAADVRTKATDILKNWGSQENIKLPTDLQNQVNKTSSTSAAGESMKFLQELSSPLVLPGASRHTANAFVNSTANQGTRDLLVFNYGDDVKQQPLTKIASILARYVTKNPDASYEKALKKIQEVENKAIKDAQALSGTGPGVALQKIAGLSACMVRQISFQNQRLVDIAKINAGEIQMLAAIAGLTSETYSASVIQQIQNWVTLKESAASAITR